VRLHAASAVTPRTSAVYIVFMTSDTAPRSERSFRPTIRSLGIDRSRQLHGLGGHGLGRRVRILQHRTASSKRGCENGARTILTATADRAPTGLRRVRNCAGVAYGL